MMADIQEQTKLQTTVDEIGMIHRSVNYVLADVERKLSHQKANSPNAHHLQWKSACESIRIARAKVVSLLRREEAAISAYSAFRGIRLKRQRDKSYDSSQAWDEQALRLVTRALERKRASLDSSGQLEEARNVTKDISRVEEELGRLQNHSSRQPKTDLYKAVQTLSPIASVSREQDTMSNRFASAEFDMMLKKIIGEDLDVLDQSSCEHILQEISLSPTARLNQKT